MDIMRSLNPQLRDFILFCVQRRGYDWPALYDEMAVVAGQRMFNNLGYAELKQLGLSLRISRLDETIALVNQAISQKEQV